MTWSTESSGPTPRAEPATVKLGDLAAVTTVAELAAVLRSLRQREAEHRPGRELSYRRLAEQTGWSLGTVSDYLNGATLPPADRFDSLVLLLGATGPELGPLASARDRVADAREQVGKPDQDADTALSAQTWVVPHELRASPSQFVGREGDLARLDALLDAGASSSVAVVTGMAGVGKTALALRWAHGVAAELFLDGQLYVDLRGYDPAEPMDPTQVLGRFLRTLGVSPDQVPLELSERVTLFRTLVAGRRLLIVLDNAYSSEQVRPLLPDSPLCTVVVTSRDSLAEIAASHAAVCVPLDVLSAADCTTLLRALVGERVDREPVAAAALIDHCGRLPLAIRIAAELAARRTTEPLARLVEDLRDERARLDALDVGEERSAIRSVLSWSFRELSPGAARLFRLLGAAPGPDLSATAVASLAGTERAEAEALLRELTRAHLVTEPTPGRYGFHDMLRAYAREFAVTDNDRPEQREAVRRLLDHYLYAAVAADRLLDPNRLGINLIARSEGVLVEAVDSEPAARAWFDADLPTLLTATELAGMQGYTAHVWQLPWVMAIYLDRSGRWQELAALSAIALDIATEPEAQAAIRHSLARVAFRLGQVETALEHYLIALPLLEQLGDNHAQALAHNNIAGIYGQSGRLHEAAEHSERALTMFEWLGHTIGQALSLNNLAYTLALLGEYAKAQDACQRALTLFNEIGEHPTQAYTWDTLGLIHRRQGDLGEAVECYLNAITLHGEGGDRLDQAMAWIHLGEAYADSGQSGAATDAWQSALAILDDLDHPEAAELRSRLEAGMPPARHAPA